jgi:hypothetical protein
MERRSTRQMLRLAYRSVTVALTAVLLDAYQGHYPLNA